MIRLLVSILVAFGLAASPLAFAGAQAHADTREMASNGAMGGAEHASHCPDADKAPAKDKHTPHACCAGAASAVVPGLADIGPGFSVVRQPTLQGFDQLGPGRTPEQDPPPPRNAPET
jgi:hypothetical protein